MGAAKGGLTQQEEREKSRKRGHLAFVVISFILGQAESYAGLNNLLFRTPNGAISRIYLEGISHVLTDKAG
jgi:hypothetical protein